MKKAFRILITFAAVLLFAASAGPAYAAETPSAENETAAEVPSEPPKVYRDRWVKENGRYYYYQKNGVKYTKTGFKKIGGKYYYLTRGGARYNEKGFRKIGGKYYYFLKGGVRYSQKGFRKIGGKYYYFLKGGVRYNKKGFRKIGGEYYYFLKGGVRYNKKGFQKIAGKYYYFLKGGKLYRETGLKRISGALYCFTKGHYIVTGAAAKTDGVLHIYAKNGKMLKNRLPFAMNGKYYRIDSSGTAEQLSEVQVDASRFTWDFIRRYTNSSDSNAVKFRKCFNRLECADYRPGYVRRSETNGTDWPYRIAVKVLRNKGRWTHNCYGFACTIASLAKELGYEPYVCVLEQDHAVVQINGRYYDNMGARFGASSPALSGWKIFKKYRF